MKQGSKEISNAKRVGITNRINFCYPSLNTRFRNLILVCLRSLCVVLKGTIIKKKKKNTTKSRLNSMNCNYNKVQVRQ